MLQRERGMFDAACDALLTDKIPALDVSKTDRDINSGERLVRRLVIEHLTLNPEQDLPASLSLVSIVHDIERIGDYAKNLVELARLRSSNFGDGKYANRCRELREDISPMLEMTHRAFVGQDPDLANQVMVRHRRIKEKTEEIIETAVQDPEAGRSALLYVVGSRYLRRISAHLSNVSSSISNPFDLISRND